MIPIPKYVIEPCEAPCEGAAEAWPGQWYRFHEEDKPCNWGYANRNTLHLYVGEEQAAKALHKAKDVKPCGATT